MIVDAGGGTIDISSYSRNQKGDFEEIAAPQCSFVFNNLKIAYFRSLYTRSLTWLYFCDLPCKTVFREYVAKICSLRIIIGLLLCLDYLSNSRFLEDLYHIVHCFDETTKLRFKNAEEPGYVKFGSTRDKDEKCNIRFGQLKLMG